MKIDEDNIPAWFDEELRAWALGECERWAKSITITGEHKALIGRKYIIAGKCVVGFADCCQFFVGKGAELVIEHDIRGSVEFGGVSGTVTTGDVSGTVTTGGVSGTGSVKTGGVSGTVTTGDVSGTVTTGDVSGTGSVKRS